MLFRGKTQAMRSPALVAILLVIIPLVLPHDVDPYPEDHSDEHHIEDNDGGFHDEYWEEDRETGGALHYLAKGKIANNVINVDDHELIKVSVDFGLYSISLNISLKNTSSVRRHKGLSVYLKQQPVRPFCLQSDDM